MFSVTANHFRHCGLGSKPKRWQQSKGEYKRVFKSRLVINSLTISRVSLQQIELQIKISLDIKRF